MRKLAKILGVWFKKWWWGLLAVFLIIYLWPLLDFQHNLIGDRGDVYNNAAQTEWFCDNFFSYNFVTDRYYYPHGVNMAKGYIMPLMMALVCPLKGWGGVAMLNAIAVMQVVLIFVSGMLVAGKYIRNGWLRLAFIFFYAFSAYVLMRLTEHINLLSTVWGLAFIVWAFEGLDLTQERRVMGAFALLGLALSASWQNWPNLLPLTILFVGLGIYTARKRWKKILVNLVKGGVTMALVMAFWVLPMMMSNLDRSYLDGGTRFWVFASIGSYIVPWEDHVAYKLFPEHLKVISQGREGAVSLDIVVVLILVAALVYWLKTKRWFGRLLFIVLAIVYALLPFGQQITVGENEYFLGYFTQALRLFPFSLSRFPVRLGIIFTFFGTLAAVMWLDGLVKFEKETWLKWLARIIGVYSVIAGVVLVKNYQVPTITYSEMVPFKSMQEIARDERQVAVLYLPVFNDQLKNFLQMWHKKPLMSGYISWSINEGHTRRVINQSGVLKYLSCFEGGYDYAPVVGRGNWDQLLVEELIALDIRYVIVNREFIEFHPSCNRLRDLLNGLGEVKGLELMEESKYFQVYQVGEGELEEEQTFVSYEWAGYEKEEDKVLLLGEQQLIYVLTDWEGRGELRVGVVNDEPVKLGVKSRLEMTEHRVETGKGVVDREVQLEKGLNTIWLINLECKKGRCEPIAIDQLEVVK